MDQYTQCGRCGRKLKDRKSVERGFGPVCWEKDLEEHRPTMKNTPEYTDSLMEEANGVGR